MTNHKGFEIEEVECEVCSMIYDVCPNDPTDSGVCPNESEHCLILA